jgi:hypothetical protein
LLFPSIPFLFYFLPLFFVIYCAAPGITAKNFFLLLASLAFYAWGEPRFVIPARARLLAVSTSVTDEDAVIDLSPYRPIALVTKPIDTQFESGGDFVETGRNGPTVLVIGDSFTRGFWQDYFGLHAGKYIWMHHELCGFAASVVERYAPDIVILAPVERQMFCFGK